MSDITADRVRGLFSYRDGALYWLKRVNSKVAAGSRAADYVTNACNSKVRSDNTSGVKGVSWCTTFNKWAVQIRRGSVLISRKFKTLEEAANFAREKRAELHGEFACEGNR